jgi:hypothetical protein
MTRYMSLLVKIQVILLWYSICMPSLNSTLSATE